MISLRELKSRLPKSPSGCHCKFVKIDEVVGIKVYRTQGMRDGCFNMQAKFAQHNLAAQVYQKLKIGDYFCYTTEVAEIWYDINEGWLIGDDNDHQRFYEDRDVLKEDLYNTFNVDYVDCCEFNYGYIVRNGEKILVFIDTDPDTFYENDEDDYEN